METLKDTSSQIVSHAILVKNGRRVTLGGSIHYGHEHERAAIQKNIDTALLESPVFFREGFNIDRADTAKLSNRLVIYFLRMIGQYYDAWAKAQKGEYIEYKLKFRHTITVDMKEEIVSRLADEGLHRYWPLFLILHLSLEMTKICRYFIYISAILFQFIITRNSNVFLDERDQLVVYAIESNSAQNIYVHYGNDHIVGMANKLIANGWKIEKGSMVKYQELKPLREIIREAYAKTLMEVQYWVLKHTWYVNK